MYFQDQRHVYLLVHLRFQSATSWGTSDELQSAAGISRGFQDRRHGELELNYEGGIKKTECLPIVLLY